jgi:hypothetical protein
MRGEDMKLEIVKSNDSQRYYKLPKPIKFYGKGKTFVDLFKADPLRLKEGIELIDDLSEIKFVCVSDAHTHIERLCFPAFEVRDLYTCEVRLAHRNNAICGYHTFLTHGGNSAMVKPDRAYIRYLMMLNSHIERNGGKV